MLNTISGGFNAIWRVSERRPLALRVLVYWALLTLGPLLLGASLSLSTYAFAVAQWSGIEDYAGPLFDLAEFLPFVLSTLGFMLLFLVVPNRAVRPRHALAGAAVAAFLFEVLKRGFGLYLAHFPSYQAIYGALAAVPIFLVWMYLSWAVVLFGAEFTAALPEWRAAVSRGSRLSDPGAKLALALSLLGRLRTAAGRGETLRESSLARGLPATLGELDQVMTALRRTGFVARGGGNRWVLGRDLSRTTLGNLVSALDLSLDPGEGWPRAVSAAVAGLVEASAEAERVVLVEILD